MDRKQLQNLLLSGVLAAHAAGEEILKVYWSIFDVNYKKDKSPVTEADKKANSIINEILHKHFHYIPIVSEEGRSISYETRSKWENYWLVDPLDGTKDFIKRNDEFTVNIALISNKKPMLGIIYLPAKDILYYGLEGFGSFRVKHSSKLFNNNKISDFNSLLDFSEKLPLARNNNKQIKVVVSRSHFNTETKNYIQKLKEHLKDIETVPSGSSIKICLVAENSADVYPRFAPTMEWDTAAGHAIIRYSGGDLIDINTKKTLVYNKKELINPHFIALKDKNLFLMDYIN